MVDVLIFLCDGPNEDIMRAIAAALLGVQASGVDQGMNHMSTAPRVVFLANDVVLQQGLAFLESFRAHNPDILLSMIPFADDIEKLSRLQKVYDFDIVDFDVARWDDLARQFFPNAEKKHLHRLRKLSIFETKGECTIYLDLDMVVLKNLKFLAQPIVDGAVDFICTATANDPWVYNPTYKNYPMLADAKRFSDGFFAFNPNKVDADLAFQTITSNQELYRLVRADQVYCQPVTNFIVDVLKLRVGEVFRLFPNISPQVWYAGQKLSLEGDRVLSDDNKEVLFVHWAGPVDMNQDFRFKALFTSYAERAGNRALAAGIAI